MKLAGAKDSLAAGVNTVSTGRWRLDYRYKGDGQPRPPRPTSPWRDVAAILLVCPFTLLVATGLLVMLLMALDRRGAFRLK